MFLPFQPVTSHYDGQNGTRSSKSNGQDNVFKEYVQFFNRL